MCTSEGVWKGVFGVWREALKGKGTGVAFVRAARAFIGELSLCSDDSSVSEEGLIVTPHRRSAEEC
jgi:hypothetical protein